MSTAPPWLVVVDMQRCFAEPESRWFVPGYAGLEHPVERLMAASSGRLVLTRFVSGPVDTAGWSDYYALWPTMRKPDDDPVWDLTVEVPAAGKVVTQTTFSKWREVSSVVPPDAPLIVCGVATDVCVLSTVLGAVDAGRSIIIAGDACAGSSRAAHAAALDVLASFVPHVAVTGVDGALGVLQGRAPR